MTLEQRVIALAQAIGADIKALYASASGNSATNMDGGRPDTNYGGSIEIDAGGV